MKKGIFSHSLRQLQRRKEEEKALSTHFLYTEVRPISRSKRRKKSLSTVPFLVDVILKVVRLPVHSCYCESERLLGSHTVLVFTSYIISRRLSLPRTLLFWQ